MKKFDRPKVAKFSDLADVLRKIETTYEHKPTLIISGAEVRSNDCFNFIPVLVYRIKQLYYVLAYNSSLNTACVLFRAVLDEGEEQDHFDNLCKTYQADAAIKFLSDNTF